MSTLDELAAWLRATISARLDQAKALREPFVVPGEPPIERGLWTVGKESPDSGFAIEPYIIGPGHVGGGVWEREDAEFIVANQPAHVIDQCEAELGLLDQYERERAEWPRDRSWDSESQIGVARVGALEDAVKWVAYGYRRMPGYREEWKP
ncbi:DUF6221 family protein (plasmid) [Microtetraspora malaysiensis]|uniref:DUF6221 family protein n=1 Tax=Microtetraspora malaysiensis TaxID=161358 RepID=UPI003D92419D